MRDQDLSRGLTKEQPPMGHLARTQQRISRSKQVTYPANLNQELALQDIEPFVLAQMHMQGCPALRMHHLLRDEEGSLSVCRDNLVG